MKQETEQRKNVEAQDIDSTEVTAHCHHRITQTVKHTLTRPQIHEKQIGVKGVTVFSGQVSRTKLNSTEAEENKIIIYKYMGSVHSLRLSLLALRRELTCLFKQMLSDPPIQRE